MQADSHIQACIASAVDGRRQPEAEILQPMMQGLNTPNFTVDLRVSSPHQHHHSTMVKKGTLDCLDRIRKCESQSELANRIADRLGSEQIPARYVKPLTTLPKFNVSYDQFNSRADAGAIVPRLLNWPSVYPKTHLGSFSSGLHRFCSRLRRQS